MTSILYHIGERIRHYRLQQGLTQQELAEASQLSLPFINQIENNHRNISMETLVKILSALDVSLSDFFKPFSVTTDDPKLTDLLLALEQSKDKDRLLNLFLEIAHLTRDA